MTLFELVKATLDELYAAAQAQYGANADAEIKKSILEIANSYGDLNNTQRKPVSYVSPAARAAYVFKYTAIHGDFIVQLLSRLHGHMGPLFTNDTVRLTCLGGGPGSDIIGVLKYLDDLRAPVTKVTCHLLDGEAAWGDAWSELDDKLLASARLSTHCQPFDVTDPKTWMAQTKYLQADLFTLSFFLSEVQSIDHAGQVPKFLRHLFVKAKPGALFLYIDNGTSDFRRYFDPIWEEAGLDKVMAADNARLTPSGSEEASVLDDYKKKFDHIPRLTGNVNYRILRKP